MALLSDRVRERREELGLTQAELSAASGVGQSSIARIESGDTPDPRGHTLAKIAAALRVSSAWLQGEEGADPPPRDGGTQRVPDVVVSDINPPTFGHIAGWDALEKSARKKAPDIDQWVWDELRVSNPLFTTNISLTIPLVVHLARVIAEHGVHPAARKK
jgi:transcriptional regulator with XRE-family HTH domain